MMIKNSHDPQHQRVKEDVFDDCIEDIPNQSSDDLRPHNPL